MERTSISNVDSSPLIVNSVRNQRNGWRFRILPRLSLRGASRILHRASNRRFLREPSVMVREAAEEELEGRQNDWAYSKPIIVLDVLWNLAFVIVAVSILYSSQKEAPFVPLRLWILGYVLQCILHSIFVCIEYHRRNSSERSFSGSENGRRSWISNEGSDARSEYEEVQGPEEENTSVAKHLESINTMFSLLWWIIGFYWVSAGGQALTHDAPQLYWLCIVFLAFDVFFVVFCVALASLIGIAVCCCLPCIIAILYAVADQEGASDEDICQLPKFIFRKVGDLEKLNWGISGSSGGIMTECGTDLPVEHFVAEKDAECCICLCPYDDGVELRELPCGHHFHCACIDKWLYINSTCPLCKYNIVKSNNYAVEEV